ncbi:acylphosphatase [Nanobdella aerobiophila]|uniref:Acylphosphatase n=1 Tax=Nanobdella aerobiophila TaxID=2586965 RepID=A0A915WRK9_9ARCH|nr:acylphosphatase [Nanobdella aerobiophila]BBL45339.1 acylphosphatase [Nanobdella aerobiophila]
MAKKVIIYGKVQGVGFRNFIYRNALRYNIKGYVKNNPDGTVEAVFEGNQMDIYNIIELCKRGPERARVDKIDEIEIKDQKYKDFKIIY